MDHPVSANEIERGDEATQLHYVESISKPPQFDVGEDEATPRHYATSRSGLPQFTIAILQRSRKLEKVPESEKDYKDKPIKKQKDFKWDISVDVPGGRFVLAEDLFHENKNYEIRFDTFIGKGSFGVVHECKLLDGEEQMAVHGKKQMVAKISLEDDGEYMKQFIEALIMSIAVKSDYVVKIISYDFLSDIIVMEHCQYGCLESFLKVNFPVNFDDLHSLLLDVAKGLVYLKEKKIVHADLAARNVMVTMATGSNRPKAKIGDFGRAMRFNDESITSESIEHVPIRYLPPEALGSAIYNRKTDVWSFGILVYEVMHPGDLPYGPALNPEQTDELVNYILEDTPIKKLDEQLEICIKKNKTKIRQRLKKRFRKDAIFCLKKKEIRPTPEQVVTHLENRGGENRGKKPPNLVKTYIIPECHDENRDAIYSNQTINHEERAKEHQKLRKRKRNKAKNQKN